MGRLKTVIFTILALAIALTAVRAYTQTNKGFKILSAQDYVEIQQLYALYTRALDVGPADGSAILEVFTPDAVFDSEAQHRHMVGRKDLQEFAADIVKNRPKNGGGRHWYSNLVVTPTPGGATATIYVMTLKGSNPPTPGIGVYGMMEDTLVKTSEGWRFKRRVYHQDAPFNSVAIDILSRRCGSEIPD